MMINDLIYISLETGVPEKEYGMPLGLPKL
jgi:hypothetical protein